MTLMNLILGLGLTVSSKPRYNNNVILCGATIVMTRAKRLTFGQRGTVPAMRGQRLFMIMYGRVLRSAKPINGICLKYAALNILSLKFESVATFNGDSWDSFGHRMWSGPSLFFLFAIIRDPYISPVMRLEQHANA